LLLKNRWTTYLIVPYILNTQKIENIKRYQLDGVGDPTVLQGIHLINPSKVYANQNFNQRLEIGAGVKIPLGSLDKKYKGEIPHIDLQPGTGSWDAIGFVKYQMKIKNAGVSYNLNYKWNGENINNYKYGNTLNQSLNLFHQTKMGNLTLIPMVGTSIERAGFDSSTIDYEDTGGFALFLQGGIQFYFNNFMLFGEYQKAVLNKMNGYTQLINKQKINIGITYSL